MGEHKYCGKRYIHETPDIQSFSSDETEKNSAIKSTVGFFLPSVRLFSDVQRPEPWSYPGI